MKIIDKQNYENFIKEDTMSFDEKWKQRNFVSEIKDYINSNIRKVLMISGLRGTGKTTGILQALKGTDGIYICAEKGIDEDAAQYKKILTELSEKVIMIDEYTWIKNRKEQELDELLDTLVNRGKRVIITGTESMCLEALKAGSLIHRTITIHTTFMSFNEYCKIYDVPMTQKNCDNYLKKGGVFEDYAVANFLTMTSYVQSAIIDNLKKYISLALPNFDMEKISNIVYSIFYRSIRDILDTKIPVRDRSIRAMDNLEQLGVNTEETLNPFEVEQISNILEQAGVIVKIPNLIPREPKMKQVGFSSDYRTYIVNPSLTWQLLCSIYDEKVLNNDLLGFVYESTCAVNMYYNKLASDSIYFVENNIDGKNFEIDFVIIQSEGTGHQVAYLFECKHSHEINLNGKKEANWSIINGNVDDKLLEMFPEGDIGGRYIVHPGSCSVQTKNGYEVLVVNQDDYIKEYYNYEENRMRISSN